MLIEKFNTFLGRLENVTRSSETQAIAFCPAHDDKKPSLSISIIPHKKTGKDTIMVNCHAGCSFESIVQKVGMEPADFFSGEDFSQKQSRLSISSGGLFGTYFSESQISEVFVPVQTTDFIFSLFSRNFGFFGGLLLVSLWIVFFFRVNRIIKRTEIEFEKYLLSGLLILLGAQIFINLFTILGFIPLTGIPFPLLSLGGSSIFSTAIIFGLINRVFIENNIVV